MISVIIWSFAAAGIFLWNYFKVPYIGIRFTERLIGFPISGGWLCVALAGYCLVRYLVRQRKDGRGAGG
ncbi:MAG TPA: hypothetical protein VM425_13110 [Myxococcota bacterium]|nr:hypothetical protein [Myxococcota bacterium]